MDAAVGAPPSVEGEGLLVVGGLSDRRVNDLSALDQWVPATGYVPSGSTQSASRTYSTEGTKTVKVLAQNQNGNSSGWATLSFSCADAQDQSTNTNQTVGSQRRRPRHRQ